MKTRNILFIGALATVIACSKNEEFKSPATSNVIELEVSAEQIATKGVVTTWETLHSDNHTADFTLSAVKTSQHTVSGDMILEFATLEGTNDFNKLLEDLTGKPATKVDTTGYYFHDSEVYHHGHWYIDGNPAWPNKDRLSFWAVGGIRDYYGVSPDVNFYPCAYTDMRKTFEYEAYALQFGINIAVNCTNTCARDQSDLLLAFVPDKSMAEGKVKLHFLHVLSGVRFILGDIAENWVVSDIKLSNVLSTEECTLQSFEDDTYYFDWRDCWTKEDSDTEETIKEKEAPFISEYWQQYWFHEYDPELLETYSEENLTFWMVPQERTVKMTVSFVDKNDIYAQSDKREFSLNVPVTWESGHLYRYRINYDGKDNTDIVLGDVNVEDYTPSTTPEVVFD